MRRSRSPRQHWPACSTSPARPHRSAGPVRIDRSRRWPPAMRRPHHPHAAGRRRPARWAAGRWTPFLGARSAGCSDPATPTSDGMTSVASLSTVTVTCRTASRLGPSHGNTVAARNTGSSTADRAAADSSCRCATVAAVAGTATAPTLLELALQPADIGRGVVQMRVRLIAAPTDPGRGREDQHPGDDHRPGHHLACSTAPVCRSPRRTGWLNGCGRVIRRGPIGRHLLTVHDTHFSRWLVGSTRIGPIPPAHGRGQSPELSMEGFCGSTGLA